MLAPTKETLPYTVYRTPRWQADGPAPPGWRRVRRVEIAAALLSLIPALVSFSSKMAQPSNSTFFINFVEWMRDNRARGLVNRSENLYYSLTAPAKGGPALHVLPGQKGALSSTAGHRVVVHYYV